jgi:hypothetical protein
MLKKAIIYLAEPMNHFCEPGFKYEKAAETEAESIIDNDGENLRTMLEKVYLYAQNGLGSDYEKLGKRSCSIGDMIEIDGEFMIVKNFGFDIAKPDFFTLRNT